MNQPVLAHESQALSHAEAGLDDAILVDANGVPVPAPVEPVPLA